MSAVSVFVAAPAHLAGFVAKPLRHRVVILQKVEEAHLPASLCIPHPGARIAQRGARKWSDHAVVHIARGDPAAAVGPLVIFAGQGQPHHALREVVNVEFFVW